MLTEGLLYASCTNHIFFYLLIFCYLYFHHLFSRLGTRNDLKNNEEEEEGIFLCNTIDRDTLYSNVHTGYLLVLKYACFLFQLISLHFCLINYT